MDPFLFLQAQRNPAGRSGTIAEAFRLMMSPFAAFLIPRQQIHANGHGPALPRPDSDLLQLTLVIESSQEQQSFEVFLEGSADGETWLEKPLAAFPQKFYPGSSAILCNLAAHPDVHHLRARWRVNRWGRGEPKPSFTVYLFAEAIPSAELDSK
jgi:hypothetical protein